jgi:hypothetical protein
MAENPKAMKNLLPALFLGFPLLVPLPSCGTLMFAERQGHEHSGKLDPNVLIMDGVGLLLFVVPGLVAFGVDFYTKAIYLPSGVEKGEGPFFQ